MRYDRSGCGRGLRLWGQRRFASITFVEPSAELRNADTNADSGANAHPDSDTNIYATAATNPPAAPVCRSNPQAKAYNPTGSATSTFTNAGTALDLALALARTCKLGLVWGGWQKMPPAALIALHG